MKQKAEVPVNAFLGRLVVVGRNAKYALNSRCQAGFELGSHLGGIVAAHPLHHRHASGRSLEYGFDYLVLFFGAQRGRFGGRT